MNIGPYTVVGMVGRGGMGIVYKATDSSHNRTVAIKMIQGSFARSQAGRMGLVREARSAGSLHHPNIVEIYDIGQHKGWLYLVMEYLHGAPLSQLIGVGQSQSLDQKLRILIELCNALDHAHTNGVVHRDVKPGNIFLTRERIVKVMDFGLAMQSGAPDDKRIAGTLPYMSPELLNGAKPDPGSDLWAVGITMYELLAGRMPFAGPNLLHDIVYSETPSLDASLPLARELNRVVGRALSKDKAARYGSARSFASDLLQLKSAFEMSSYPSVEVTENIIVDSDTHDRELSTNSGASSSESENWNHAQQQTADYLRGVDLRFSCNASGPIAISSGIFRLRGRLRILSELLLQIMGFGFLVLSLMAFGTLAIAIGTISWILGHWLVSLAVFLAFLTVALGIKTIEIGSRAPRCDGCHLSMLHSSRWTRFVQTQAEVVMGYRDCIAALQEGLWEEAAKLLTVHGSEPTSFPAGSLVISTPLRYHLDFFECRLCSHHAARMTADNFVEDSWMSGLDFTQAYQGSELSAPPMVYRILLAAPQTTSAIFRVLKLDTPRIDHWAIVVALGALALVLVVAPVLVWSNHVHQANLRYFAKHPYLTLPVIESRNLALSYYGRHEGQAAKYYFEYAAAHGDSFSAYMLGTMYETGFQSLPRDYGKAIKWYEQAAEQEDTNAELNLGRMYDNGTGVSKDLPRAAHWYGLAAKAGSEEAKKRLSQLKAVQER